MEAPLELPVDELTRLRGCLTDVVGIMALSGLWAGGEPDRIGSTLVDALLEMLDLTFVFVRLNQPETGRSKEIVRLAESWKDDHRTQALGVVVDAWLDDGPLSGATRAGVLVDNVNVSIASVHLGVHGAIGVVVTGSERLDFPSETERLLLELAANQATIGLQQALMLSEQKRLTSDLDARVAQRTTDVATANELLKSEIAERRRTEEALRESERESRLIVDSIPGMIALLSATGDLEVGNRQLLEYFGQTMEQLRRWGTNDTVHPDDLPHVLDVFTRAIASGSSFEIVQRFKRADSVYRWFFNRGFPLRDANGTVARWCVLLTDIDERKRADDALRASELNLRQLTETIPEMLWSATPDGGIDYCNTRFLEYTGFSMSEVRVDGWQKTIHPDDAVRVAPVWMSCIATGAAYRVEVRTFHAADATYRWCAVNALPLFDADGRIVKWHGSIVDIHDWKQAQHDLQRAHDHLTEAQRLSQTGSFSLDLERDEHYWSDEFYRICEFEPGSPVTIHRLREIVHPEDAPSCETAVSRAMAGIEPDFYFRIVTARGVVKHLRGFAHRIADRPVFVGAVQDVTASKMGQDALNKAGAELAHVSRVTSVSVLAASVAHEVNQPLSGIMTNAGTCLRMLDSTPPDIGGARETARRTIRDANRASDVITRLRALFSKREFALEPLDLNEATREVIALSLNDLQSKRIVLRSELADDLPVVQGDRIQLQQVVLNLLRNASDAMVDVHDRPRQVLLRTVPDDDGVRVTIRDSGVGVPLASMDSVFHPFYTTKSGGMGIGLFVSRSIVERHRGRLWIERNDDGPGATFSFSIPVAPESLATPTH